MAPPLSTASAGAILTSGRPGCQPLRELAVGRTGSIRLPSGVMRVLRRRSSLARRVLPVAALLALVVPALAFAHIERASYWPDPAPDTSVTPPAGGQVPRVRTLASALVRT